MEVDIIKKSFEKLKEYCEKSAFEGYDPYDGLNSEILSNFIFFKKSHFFRLCWIQLFKKLPINFRNIALIKKDINPKAMGIFLSAYCEIYKNNKSDDTLNKVNFFIEKIYLLKNKNYSGACWGYNFDWQSRAFFQPKNTPNIVTSSFIANSLLDAYNITGDNKLLDVARSTCDFIIKDLNINEDKYGNKAFSYSPLDKSIVYNASLLGARLLSRVYSITQENILYDFSKSAVDYCCNMQNKNGSWTYGKLPFHQWIDNFHTGYNLECISDYTNYTQDNSVSKNLSNGFDYYINTFFLKDGKCKYYSNKIYPIDIHAPAQLIITLNKLKKLDAYKDTVDNVIKWTIKNMQSKKGFFYYQVNKIITNKIPYMRWSQAWMLYSLSIYFNHLNKT